MSIFVYSFIKIFSVQYAKTCHVYIIYDRTSVLMIDYTGKFKMHQIHTGFISCRFSIPSNQVMQ